MTRTADPGLADWSYPDATELLPADTGAPATARRLIAARTGHLPVELREAAALLVSELVTNAVLHCRSDISLHMATSPRAVRVGVHDRGAAMPVRAGEPVETTQVGGRGLIIVDALAANWGVTASREPPGKCVWFELGDPGPAERPRRRS
jgi:anti-sigma regulatory factor (Ser/Thr protein kinase)